MLDPAEARTLSFDPLDPTNIFPEDQFPLMPIGRMVLDRNPENYFAEVEQAAFAPAVVVPGIELSNDKLLQGRAFSYPDTQRYRLGANYLQIPVTCPYSATVRNNQCDGCMTMKADPNPINYEPSPQANALVEAPANPPSSEPLAGNVVRMKIAVTNDFQQAGERFRSLSAEEQQRLVPNLAFDMKGVQGATQKRMLCHFARADFKLGAALGIDVAAPTQG